MNVTLRHDMKEKGWMCLFVENLGGGLLGSNLPPRVTINSPPYEHDTLLVRKTVRLVFLYRCRGEVKRFFIMNNK